MTTGAVVTTYDPDLCLQQLLRALAPQVERVVVVDNTPGVVPGVVTRACRDGCRVVRLGSNRGLAAALNVGLDVLWGLNRYLASRWDQDRLPPDDYVESLLQAAQTSPAWPHVLAAGVRRSAPQQRQHFSPDSGPLAGRATVHSVRWHHCIARNEAVLLRFRGRDREAVRSVAADRRRLSLRVLQAGPLRVPTAVAVARGLLGARRGSIDFRCLPSAVDQVAP